MIDAATTLTIVNTEVPITNEGQARALGQVVRDLGAEAAAEVLEQVAATGIVTATRITQAAQQRNPITPQMRQAADDVMGPLVLDEPGPRPHVANNSGNNEWYTPGHIIEAARTVLGRIDLDPASSAKAQATVKADRWFSETTDGLASDWGDAAAIWMNPPYAQPLIGLFVAKFCDHLASGGCGIVLVNNATETGWGARLLADCDAVCFPTGRIRFIDPAGNPGAAPLQGQMIGYIGRAPDLFADYFAVYGPVLRG
jgi:phage N-6-adenine-methyltransferase